MHPKLSSLSERLTKFYGPLGFPKPSDPFRVLVGFLLSQRTTDRITEKIEDRLFKVVISPRDLARLPAHRLRELIRPVNFYRTKSSHLKSLAKIIVEEHGGNVPENRADLLRLPGVGPKTADGTMLYGFGQPYFPVDIHLARVVRRIGLADRSRSAVEIGNWFRTIRPKTLAYKLNRHLLSVGKEFCHPRKPNCPACPAMPHCRFGAMKTDSLNRLD